MVRELAGPLLTNDGRHVTHHSLSQCRFVLVYLWRDDSPKVTEFSERLLNWYMELSAATPNIHTLLEVVVAPVRAKPHAHNEFVDENPWVSLPLGDPRIEELLDTYELGGEESQTLLPRVLVLSPQPRGTLFVSEEGVSAIESAILQQSPYAAVEKWTNLLATELQKASKPA